MRSPLGCGNHPQFLIEPCYTSDDCRLPSLTAGPDDCSERTSTMQNIPQSTNNPYVLADELEARQLLNLRLVRSFSCRCCRLIWTYLPGIAQEALGIAEASLHHQASDDLLVDMRVRLWNFLGTESCNFASPTVNAIRAVICCLYPDVNVNESGDLYDMLTSTMDFCNAVEPCQERQYQLLRAIFQISQ